ncbi:MULTISPECIES: hypothetical protein [unclassified Streptomyces]|uniref:hypothetical protein n=1 Tax=unclassified Streptomyces TaxID=2593676 RepID=UPI002E1C1992|nr:hypothetical protein OG217_17550 [Streptomyces sp. NBC_01023]
MKKKMLRSVLAAVFSATVLFGAVSAADLGWGSAQATAVPSDLGWGSVHAATPLDLGWGATTDSASA